MKIAHLGTCLLGGGIENFLISLAREQIKQGHTIYVIITQKWENNYEKILKNKLEEEGIIVYNLGKERGSKISFLKACYKCRKILKENNVDILNSHGPMNHVLAKIVTSFSTIKYVATIHNAPEKWSNVLKLVCRNVPMIFCSEAAYELREQNSSKIIAIDNGIDPLLKGSDKTTNLRKEYNLNISDKIVVLVGSLRKQKNYLFLKDIVKALNNSHIHFFICGGIYDKKYIQLKDLVEDTIHPLGLRSDIDKIENEADLFLSCSLFEGLPISVLEAYFSGLPCVLSPILQMKKISDVPYVYIPKEFTAESFVDSINLAFTSMKSHSEILKTRSDALKRFHISVCAKKYIEFYSTL